MRAVSRDYFPDKEQLSTYASQLQEGLQTLVQGPLDYRLTDFLNSWNDLSIGVHQSEFNTAARLTIATLDAGPHTSNKNHTPLGAKDWGNLASACLAAIVRGYTRPLTEVSCKAYATFWDGLDDHPQCPL